MAIFSRVCTRAEVEKEQEGNVVAVGGIFGYIELGCAVIVIGCLFCFLIMFLTLRGKKVKYVALPQQPPQTRFAVIIPARNESRVIEGNLRALHEADYPAELFDTYVIVERMDDPTVEICKNYPRTHIFLRQNLDHQGKGYALDECIKSIFAGDIAYDAFLFLDADNIVCKNFFSRMNDACAAGYDAACGKRNNKDWNASTVAASSGVIFTIINSIQNKPKAARGMNVTVSGTGFCVKCDVLRPLGGWPFFTLTEDYEFSTYAVCHGLRTTYIDDAMFYDEQPVRFWQSIIQRTRWVKGYFTVWKKYRKDKREYHKNAPDSKDLKSMQWGTVPGFIVVVVWLVYFFAVLARLIISLIAKDGLIVPLLIRLGGILALFYFAVFFLTIYVLILDRKYIDLTPFNAIKTVLYNPVYLASFAIAAVRSLFLKNKWEVIEHTLGTDAVKL